MMTVKENYKILGKYIKDLKFKIPNSKVFSLLSKNISNYKINIDIKSNQIKKNIIEVLTSLNLTPIKDNLEKIKTEVVLATIVELSENEISKQVMEKIILVDVPTEVYGDLRRIFVSLFENSGFKDIKISETLDFQNLYSQKKIQ